MQIGTMSQVVQMFDTQPRLLLERLEDPGAFKRSMCAALTGNLREVVAADAASLLAEQSWPLQANMKTVKAAVKASIPAIAAGSSCWLSLSSQVCLSACCTRFKHSASDVAVMSPRPQHHICRPAAALPDPGSRGQVNEAVLQAGAPYASPFRQYTSVSLQAELMASSCRTERVWRSGAGCTGRAGCEDSSREASTSTPKSTASCGSERPGS